MPTGKLGHQQWGLSMIGENWQTDISEAISILASEDDQMSWDDVFDVWYDRAITASDSEALLRAMTSDVAHNPSFISLSFHLLRRYDPSGVVLEQGMTLALGNPAFFAFHHIFIFDNTLPKEPSPDFCRAFLAFDSKKRPWLWRFLFPLHYMKMKRKCERTLSRAARHR